MRFSSRLQDAHSHLKHFSFADESSGNPDATHSGSQIELETALEERDKETKQLERPYAAPLEADVVMFNFQKILNQSANPSENFCVPWDVNTDDWWTHHPKWRVTHENDTHTCFSIFHDSTARHDCIESSMTTNFMASAARCICAIRGAPDGEVTLRRTNIVYGLQYALLLKIPFALSFLRCKPWWHYAANKKVR